MTASVVAHSCPLCSGLQGLADFQSWDRENIFLQGFMLGVSLTRLASMQETEPHRWLCTKHAHEAQRIVREIVLPGLPSEMRRVLAPTLSFGLSEVK